MTTPEQIAAATPVRGLWCDALWRHDLERLRDSKWSFRFCWDDCVLAEDDNSALQLLLANGQIVIVRKKL
jgi:hypothetical protein